MFDHCMYFNTTALARRLEREWSTAFAPFELTPPQAFMLRAILQQPGLLQRELADALGISRPTATRALDGLAAKGLVERRGTERDARESTVHPTPQGVALHKPLDDASGAVTRRLKKLLGEQVFVETVSQVRGVRSALQ